ncbi:MAG: leucine dehydrogenase, partial [Flavobacteriales bacterium]|nr:leucine dehydrogenase [Flavobacteriales bacterium]
KIKTKDLIKKFGEYVDSLGGKYITAKDVGMNTQDMEYVREKTKHVTGIPESMGGSGDPSTVTAYGVYMGMKASAKFKWGSDSLEGKTILVQGVGHVGETLVKHTTEEGAKVYITDINDLKLAEVAEKYGAEIIKADSIYDMDMDIYAPCALGSTLNTDTINRLKCQIITGAANNQLSDEVLHGKMIKDKGIVYAPDFLINAGGLINVYSEISGYQREESLLRTKKIYDTTLEILLKAEDEDITTHQAALLIAEQRIQENK